MYGGKNNTEVERERERGRVWRLGGGLERVRGEEREGEWERG